jgi:hypothetical protein
MTDKEAAIVAVIVIILLQIFIFTVFVAFTRWLFRVTHIVRLLQDILEQMESFSFFRCSMCDFYLPADEAKRIESGQLVCRDCAEKIAAGIKP